MKKFLALMLVSFGLVAIISSCGSSRIVMPTEA